MVIAKSFDVALPDSVFGIVSTVNCLLVLLSNAHSRKEEYKIKETDFSPSGF